MIIDFRFFMPLDSPGFDCFDFIWCHINDFILIGGTLRIHIGSMSHGFLADLLVQRIILPAFTMTVHCWIYYNYAFIRPAHQPWHHIVAFLGVDFCYYWAHRAGHEVNIFWATHQVHHSSERYVRILHEFFSLNTYIDNSITDRLSPEPIDSNSSRNRPELLLFPVLCAPCPLLAPSCFLHSQAAQHHVSVLDPYRGH